MQQIVPFRTNEPDVWRSSDGLRDLVRFTQLTNFNMAELGSYSGDSTEVFLEFPIQRLYVVDSWLPQEDIDTYNPRMAEVIFDRRLAWWRTHSSCDIVKLKMDTSDAVHHIPDNSLDLIYLDTEHTYECVMQTVQLWTCKLKDDGFFAGHDYSQGWAGVMLAVDQLASQFGPFETFQDTSWAFQIHKAIDTVIICL